MKTELKFVYDTENFDQVAEIETMQNAKKFRSILWELDQELRNTIKYSPDEGTEAVSEEVKAALQKVRDSLWEKVREENVNIE